MITVVITVAVRPAPVAMLLGDAAVEPSSPCPDPSHEKRREEENYAQGPLPVVLVLCTLPTAMPSLAPTHSPPRPSHHPPSTPQRPPCPVLLDAQRQGPRAGELLDALALVAPTYKYPRRSNEETRPVPSYLPDTLTSSRSP
jgi:hypothetical protein